MLVGCLYLRHAQLSLLTYSVSYALSSHHRLNLSCEVLVRRGGGWGDPIPGDTAVHLCILIAIDSSLCGTHAARSRHSTSSPKRFEYFLMIPMTCTRDSRDHRLFVRCPLRTPTNISNSAAPFKRRASIPQLCIPPWGEFCIGLHYEPTFPPPASMPFPDLPSTRSSRYGGVLG